MNFPTLSGVCSRMKLSEKVKIALEETRMLILGAQILLGFQLRSAFGESFDALPTHIRYLDGLTLGLLVVTISLLIAPEPYHRIVEGGRDSGRLHQFVIIADLALLPLALALGIDLFIGAERVVGDNGAIAGGTIAAALAFALWYGFPQLRRPFLGKREHRMTLGQHNERADTPLHVKIEQLLVEARVILPGAQALLGFQLAIVLTQSFEGLPVTSKIVHAASLFLVALAVMLLMAPASYHRIVYAGEDTEDMHRVGNVLVTASTLPLGFGLAGDVYVVIAKILASSAAGMVAGGLAFLLLTGLWYIYPLAVSATRSGK